MSATTLYASIEKRLEVLQELSRRNETTFVTGRAEQRPSITISREFGCEALAVAEKTQELLQEKTGNLWGLLDKKLLDKLGDDQERTVEVLSNLGEKNPFLDEAMSTILTEWKSDKDYFQSLCNQIVPLAKGGHVIIVGVGGGILTQKLPNCHHFRIVAPMEFKVESVARRHGIPEKEAERLIVKMQKQRNAFISDFLNRDVTDPTLYCMVFNRAQNSVQQIADVIVQRVLA